MKRESQHDSQDDQCYSSSILLFKHSMPITSTEKVKMSFFTRSPNWLTSVLPGKVIQSTRDKDRSITWPETRKSRTMKDDEQTRPTLKRRQNGEARESRG
jgi:hypothetical protein